MLVGFFSGLFSAPDYHLIANIVVVAGLNLGVAGASAFAGVLMTVVYLRLAKAPPTVQAADIGTTSAGVGF